MLLFFALSGMGICRAWHAKNPVSFLVVAGHSSTSEVARVGSLWRLPKACRVVTDGFKRWTGGFVNLLRDLAYGAWRLVTWGGR